MDKLYNQILKYTKNHKEEMLNLWREIVDIDSGTEYIEGVNKVLKVLKEKMENLGLTTNTVPMENAGDLLIGEYNKESIKEPIIFIGHMDTVFPVGDAAKRSFKIIEDKAYGPGVLDMKGGLIIGLYATAALKEIGYTDRPIKLVFVGDEELLHRYSRTKEEVLKATRGAKAAFNFETGHPDNGIVVGRKGGGQFAIDIEGIAVHSGIAPEKGRSAIEEAAHKIIKLQALNDYSRNKLVNCGVVNGGISENTVPGTCKVTGSLRFSAMAVKEEIIKNLHKIAEENTVADIKSTLTFGMQMDCMETTEGVTSLFNHLKNVAEKTGYGQIYPKQIGGASDSAITVVNGVPTVCGMGVIGTGNHTDNEYALVESLFTRTALTACAVYELK